MNEKQKQASIQALEKTDWNLLLKQKAAMAEAIQFLQDDSGNFITSVQWKLDNDIFQGYSKKVTYCLHIEYIVTNK